jgi:hypothetical protein
VPLPPPLLEIYVVWHPDDDDLGRQAATVLHEHFHGPTFSGLAGGAVEVYVRSQGWLEAGGAPRPLPTQQPLPHGLPAAQTTVVLPVVGTGLARALSDTRAWASYVDDIARSHQHGRAFVLPLIDTGAGNLGNQLAQLTALLSIPLPALDGAPDFCREVAQGIAQHVAADGDKRITVFISHTKRLSLEENDEDGPRLFNEVRAVVAGTRLAEFFDAHDLQPGTEWADALDAAASRSALIMIRTDRYAEREWTQREVLTAKRHDVPAVVLYGLRTGEQRGSFLMDHVPGIPCDLADPRPGITRALNRLVDETLKRALWRHQTTYLKEHGFDWLPVHAPEPLTLTAWLQGHRATSPQDEDLTIIHPDPPLGRHEKEVLDEICGLAGYDGRIDIVTPRTFAARGGRRLL